MSSTTTLSSIVVRSEDVVSRLIDNQVLIIPLTSGMANADDSLYTLSPTAQDIWDLLDGERTLLEVIEILSAKYNGNNETLQEDVLGFVHEMLSEKLVRQK